MINEKIGEDACLIKGLGFTEGPLWTQQATLMAVGLSRGLVYELDPDNGQILESYNAGGRPNGLAQAADGSIWIAQAGGAETKPSVQRLYEGTIQTGVTGPFDAPNDLVFDSSGRLWFTDPKGEAISDESVAGRVWCFDPVTGELAVKIDSVFYPNGLAFSEDEKQLYVAETSTGHILVFDMQGGEPICGRKFAKLPKGVPDGIALDSRGRVYAASVFGDAIYRFDSNGELAGIMTVPDGHVVTNLCFGGDGLSRIFISVAKGGAIYSVVSDTQGLSLPTLSPDIDLST